jgi:predicted Zn-dependent protease
MRRRANPAFALVLALSLLAAGAEAQTKISPSWNLFSAQQDAQIGYQSAIQAERQLPLVRDAAVESYVNRIGQRLARHAGGPGFQYRFRVVDSGEINAFALPGGYVYLNRGILQHARNEGEVAGVLAHEIAHVALRHGTHQASKAQATQAGLQILGGLLNGRVGNRTAQVLNVAGGVGLNALFLKFTRDLETQADVRGAQILAAAGYSPSDMIGFFHQLERSDRSQRTTWLHHHPAPPDRIRRIEQERKLLRVSSSPTRRSSELAKIQSRLQSRTAGRRVSTRAHGR